MSHQGVSARVKPGTLGTYQTLVPLMELLVFIELARDFKTSAALVASLFPPLPRLDPPCLSPRLGLCSLHHLLRCLFVCLFDVNLLMLLDYCFAFEMLGTDQAGKLLVTVSICLVTLKPVSSYKFSITEMTDKPSTLVMHLQLVS